MKLYLPFVPCFPFFSASGEAVIGENSCVRSCPTGWDEMGDNCFLWSKVSKTKTWAGAEQFCGEEGRGHLASVRDQYIHGLIDYAQAKLGKIRESEEQISVWVGGTDKGHEGKWRWKRLELHSLDD